MLWWKIYFWIYLIGGVLGYIILSQTIFSWNIADWSNLVADIIFFIGVYNYTFKKHFFSPKVWQIIFWTAIGFLIFNLLDVFILPESLKTLLKFFDNSYHVSSAQLIVGILFAIPAYYAVYKLSKSKIN